MLVGDDFSNKHFFCAKIVKQLEKRHLARYNIMNMLNWGLGATQVLAGARGELIREEICGRFFELYVYDEPEDMLLVVGKSNHHLATLDRLTGLANSEYFYELAQDIIENQWEKAKLVFVYFNIDNLNFP